MHHTRRPARIIIFTSQSYFLLSMSGIALPERNATLPSSNPGFNQRIQAIEQSLAQLTAQSLALKFDHELGQLKREITKLQREISEFSTNERGLREREAKINELEQKWGILEQQQQRLDSRERKLNERDLRETKELQILNMHERLKQELFNEALTNRFNQEKLEFHKQISTKEQQNGILKQQLQTATEQIASLQQTLQSTAQNLKAQETKNHVLTQANQKQAERWESQINTFKAKYEQMAKQFEKVIKLKYEIQLEKASARVANIEHQRQAQNQQHQLELQKYKQLIQDYKQNCKTYLKSIMELQEKQRTAESRQAVATTQLQKLKMDYNHILQEKQSIEVALEQEFKQHRLDSINSIQTQVEAIKKDHQQIIQQITAQNAARFQKQGENYAQQLAKSAANATQHATKLQEAQISFQNQLRELKRQNQAKANNLQQIITKICRMILDRTISIANSGRIVDDIETEMSRRKSQLELLQRSKAEAQSQRDVFAQDAQEIRNWFRNIGSLLGSPEAAAALEKQRQYRISDADVVASINSFTAKLQARLTKSKKNEDDSEVEIIELKEEIRQIKIKEEDQRTILTRLTQKSEAFQKELQTAQNEKESAERSYKQSAATTQRLEKQVKQLQGAVAVKEAEIISLKAEINNIQTVKIAAYAKRIGDECNKSEALTARLAQLQSDLQQLNQEKRVLADQLAASKAENLHTLKKAEEATLLAKARERDWNSTAELQANKFKAVLRELFEDADPGSTVDSMLDFLKNNRPGGAALPLSVSLILEGAARERARLEGHLRDFLECRSIRTTFLYKYDEFNKNFANYLPLKSPYAFLLLARTRKAQLFGVIASGIGARARAVAFNLSSGKTFPGDPNVSSSSYDGGYLMFGQGEMRFRTNSTLEMVVTTRIFSDRYFRFTKEELVGPETDDSVQLDALEIHRLDG